ncbi:MAG: hypothetical protein IKV34_01050, partial [Clostridia bacterium]|nr:hypothetical protein [Clostridia bacterium]
MKRFLTTLLFVLTIATAIFFGSPTVAFAQEEQPAKPMVVANNSETTANGYAYISFSAQNFVDVGGIEIFVFYNKDLFEINSQWTGYLLDGAFCTVNTDTPGEIRLNAISLDGINGNGELFCMYFYVKQNVQEGKYPVTIAIGEAYSKTLEPIEIGTQNFYINVNKSQQQLNTVDIYGYPNLYQAKQGDVVEMYYYTYSGHNFASGDFEINYDEKLFKLKSIDLGYELKNATSAVYSINDTIGGYVKVSYAALSGINNAYPILTAQFEVVQNVNETTAIEFLASAMYDVNLNPLNGTKVTNEINVVYQEPPKDLPDITISNHKGCVKEFSVDITTQQKTNLAAGDFVVTYDATILEFKGATKVADNTMVVVNPNSSNGTIKFSFICQDGIDKDAVVARLTFKPKQVISTSISVTGSNLVNADMQSVSVDYIPSTITLQHDVINHSEKAPTCTQEGNYAYEKCKTCDYSTYRAISALGHNLKNNSAKAPTCTEIGWNVYQTCTRCDHSTYEQIPALGHDEITHEGRVPTCTSIGWSDYETCSRCDHSTYEELASLGHDTVYHDAKEPTCLEIGWNAYQICNRCNYSTYQPIKSLGHDITKHDAKLATCKEAGWYAYEDCSRCDHSTYQEMPVVNHDDKTGEEKEPTCTEFGWSWNANCGEC